MFCCFLKPEFIQHYYNHTVSIPWWTYVVYWVEIPGICHCWVIWHFVVISKPLSLVYISKHWSMETHICVSELDHRCSGNSLSFIWCQATIRINADDPWETIISNSWTKICYRQNVEYLKSSMETLVFGSLICWNLYHVCLTFRTSFLLNSVNIIYTSEADFPRTTHYITVHLEP